MRPGCSLKGRAQKQILSASHQTGWTGSQKRAEASPARVGLETHRLRSAVDEMRAGRRLTTAACRWDRREPRPTGGATSRVKGGSHFLSACFFPHSEDAGGRRERKRREVRAPRLVHTLMETQTVSWQLLQSIVGNY